MELHDQPGRTARVDHARPLTDYFNFNGSSEVEEEYRELDGGRDPSSAQDRDDLTRVFSMWHNGSVRELAVSLHNYLLRASGSNLVGERAAEMALDTADSYLAVYQSSRGIGPRTVLFRHVLFHGTSFAAQETSDFPQMHESCMLFRPTAGEREFAFPTARILQCLNKGGDLPRVTVGSLQRALEWSQVDKDSVSRTIVDACWRRGHGSGLLRVDTLPIGDDGKPLRDTVEADEVVELLPAGKILISRLVYVIEFQYWATVSDARARNKVAEYLQINERTLVDREFIASSTNRVNVALAYLARVLIPRLAHDHRYLYPDIEADDVEAAQLVRFATTFGFDYDDWHISRAVDQIVRFLVHDPRQRGRDHVRSVLSEPGREAIDYLWSVIDHLNATHRRAIEVVRAAR